LRGTGRYIDIRSDAGKKFCSEVNGVDGLSQLLLGGTTPECWSQVFALVFAIGFHRVWSPFGGGWIGVRRFGDGGDGCFPGALMLRRSGLPVDASCFVGWIRSISLIN